MVRKLFLLIICFQLFSSLSFSQELSPAFQVMSSNSLLDQPEIFRKLKYKFDDELYENFQPGLKFESQYEKMSQYRKDILNRFDLPEIVYKNKKKVRGLMIA